MAVDFRSETLAPPQSSAGKNHFPQANNRPWWTPALITAVIVFYAVFCFHYAAKCATGSDASGYLSSAILLDRGETSFPLRKIPGLNIGRDGVTALMFMPIGLKATKDERLVPGYPAGLSLFIAAFGKLFSWNDALRLNAVSHALAGVVITYLLARDFRLSRVSSLLATVLVGGSPVYIFMSLQPMSDGPSLVWTGLTLLLARRGRARPRLMPLAGMCLAVAVLLRPTNALMVFPLLVTLVPSWRQGLMFLAGGLPGAAFLLVYNFQTYGHPFGNGYIMSAEVFSSRWAGASLLGYLKWLPILYSPIVALGLVFPWLNDPLRRFSGPFSNAQAEPRISLSVRDKLTLIAWTAAFFIFYAFYFYTAQTWWYQRFLLPAMIPILVAAAHGLNGLLDRFGSRPISPDRDGCRFPSIDSSRTAAISVCIAAAMLYQIFWIRHLHALGPGRSSEPFLQAHQWVAEHETEKPIVLCMEASGSLFAYTSSIIVRWDWVSPEAWTALKNAADKNHQRIYAVLDSSEVERARQKIAARFRQESALGNVAVFSVE